MQPLLDESGVLKVDISKQKTDNREYWEYKWSYDARKMYWPQLTAEIQRQIEKCLGQFRCFKIIYIIVVLALLTPAILIILNTGLKDDGSNQTTKTLMISFSVWCLSLPLWGCWLKRRWIMRMKKLIRQMNRNTMKQGYRMEYHQVGCCYTRFMILFFAIDNRSQNNINYSMR